MEPTEVVDYPMETFSFHEPIPGPDRPDSMLLSMHSSFNPSSEEVAKSTFGSQLSLSSQEMEYANHMGTMRGMQHLRPFQRSHSQPLPHMWKRHLIDSSSADSSQSDNNQSQLQIARAKINELSKENMVLSSRLDKLEGMFKAVISGSQVPHLSFSSGHFTMPSRPTSPFLGSLSAASSPFVTASDILPKRKDYPKVKFWNRQDWSKGSANSTDIGVRNPLLDKLPKGSLLPLGLKTATTADTVAITATGMVTPGPTATVAANTTATVRADTATVAANTTTVVADSMTVAADTSTVVADTSTVVADTSMVVADTSTVVADTMATAMTATTMDAAATVATMAADTTAMVTTTPETTAVVTTLTKELPAAEGICSDNQEHTPPPHISLSAIPDSMSCLANDLFDQGEHSAVEPVPVAISVDEKIQEVSQTRKGKKMRPSPVSVTARNFCAQDWCAVHPNGTTAEFKHYYDHELSLEVKKMYEQRSMEAKAKKSG